MKLLVFLLAMSVSVPVFAAQTPHLKLLTEGKLPFRSYFVQKLAPTIYQHIRAAGDEVGIDANQLEKVFSIAAIMSIGDRDPSASMSAPVEEQDNNVLTRETEQYAPERDDSKEDLEEMLADINEFFREAKLEAMSDIHGKIIQSVTHGKEHLSPFLAHHILEIDFELAEKFVQATAMGARQGILFAQYSSEDISQHDLIEATRLLLHEYQDLIEPSLRKELLDALELDSYPAGILDDR